MSGQDFNLYAHFEEQFGAHEDKELLCTISNASYRYSDIERMSARFANLLSAIGANPGDRVSACVRKSPEALCLYLACLRAGFVYQPLNPAYKTAELQFFFGDAEPAVVVCDPTMEKIEGLDRLVTLDGEGRGTLIEQSQQADDKFHTVPRHKDDLAVLPYSSGTTGAPKGIMLTHGNLLSNIETLANAWGLTENDRLLHALPIYHVHGLFVAIGCVLSSGASMRWLPAYDAGTVLNFLPECTVMMGVPTYYTRLLAREDFNAERCENMRVFISGSAPLLSETFAAFEARTGHRILERYGMTETGMNTSNPLSGVRKPGTVGLPLPGVEVRIVDELGNLQVRGPNVFPGYWNLHDRTAEDFTADGYFMTGDLARIDVDGYVSIVGRAKDMIITGGLNVYPKEIECFIDDLSSVKECAVIGVPHRDFGEAVVAVVVLMAGVAIGESDIIQAAKEYLANYKIPKHIVFVDELPRNAMAKVQKQSLRETYQKLFA